jgi:hypothetical protein
VIDLGFIPRDHASHHPVISDLRPKLAVFDVPEGQGAADLSDQSPEQRRQIVPWLTDQLKPIASRMSIAKLDRIQRSAGTEQTRLEMKHMGFPCAVNKLDGIEIHSP